MLWPAKLRHEVMHEIVEDVSEPRGYMLMCLFCDTLIQVMGVHYIFLTKIVSDVSSQIEMYKNQHEMTNL